MKTKLTYVLGLTVVLGLSSCDDESIVSQSGTVKSITVTGQDFLDGDDITRAAYTVDATGFHFSWTEGDTVGIYPIGGDQVAFPISSGEGSRAAQFDGGAWALRSSYLYAAYYPFSSKYYHVEETSIPVSYLGQIQNGNGSLDCLDRFDYQASVATSPDADGNVNIELKHLGCFVRFQLTMPEADIYKSITLKSSKTPFVTSGTFDLTKEKVSINPTTKSSSITIGLNQTFTTEENKILTIYAMLAPTDLSQDEISIKIVGTYSPSYTTTITGKNMMMGKAYNYQATVVNAMPDLSQTEARYGDLIIYQATADSTDVTSFDIKAQIDGLSTLEDYSVYFYYTDTESTPNEKNGIRVKANINNNGLASYKLINMNMPSSYFFRVAVTTFEGDILYGPVNSYTVTDMVTKGEKVDLGIPGVLFASCNLGADSPEQLGDLYAWGETQPKTTFSLSNYEYYNSSTNAWKGLKNDISGTQYDAATAVLSEGWHMPNKDVMSIMSYCYYSGHVKRIYYQGVFGYLVIGFGLYRDNAIFLPESLDYSYWTSTKYDDESAMALTINFPEVEPDITKVERYCGCYIRPVYGTCEYPMEYVDLGLSVKWATCNIGACLPELFGDYYAWGETETKSNYDWSTYKWCNGSYNTLTKYNTRSGYGTVDNKTVLDPEDDVAHVKWGGDWRLPTKEELDELSNNCTWTWYSSGNSEFGGVAGCKVTSKKSGYTDRFIFLPAAGCRDETGLDGAGSYGHYWSSSFSTDYSSLAWGIYFGGVEVDSSNRSCGRSVRPVCP
ncbi:MAG: hypothetical protein J6T18_03415 [Bacteroidaceae bacterium]|nr:hypothetical protein [Bacteroidaceae bacterium]